MKAYFMSQGSSPSVATQQAYSSIWGIVPRQAAMLSYNDRFFFLSVVFVSMIPFLFRLLSQRAGRGAAMVH
jgi:MFS transporter, DHA2 family, multidrug resistance protein